MNRKVWLIKRLIIGIIVLFVEAGIPRADWFQVKVTLQYFGE